VQLADGAVGHSYVQGTSRDHALRAAVLDALMQGTEAAKIEEQVFARLEIAAQAQASLRAAKAAATKVEFFTLLRGESE
jgi:alpha-D-ribose 1-methylphosphonate 5-triphosphate synthase subunit PhnG